MQCTLLCFPPHSITLQWSVIGELRVSSNLKLNRLFCADGIILSCPLGKQFPYQCNRYLCINTCEYQIQNDIWPIGVPSLWIWINSLFSSLLVTCDIFLLPDVWKLWRKNSRKISVGDMVSGLWNICQMNKCYLFYSAICSGWLKEFED